MGFVDYTGQKEDNYTDVIEFAKAQQEEEKRRLEDARIGRWMDERFGDGYRYVGLSFQDLIRHIMLQYRQMKKLADRLLLKQDEALSFHTDILWKDFCIAIVTKQLSSFSINEDKRNTCYQTFLEKVFRLSNVTSAVEHYGNMRDNAAYRRYFDNCFDLASGKLFWKWIGHLNTKEDVLWIEFIDSCEKLSVLLGYYLYLGIRPNDSLWMENLDRDHKLYSAMKTDNSRMLAKKSDYCRMRNPLYEAEATELISGAPDKKDDRSHMDMPEKSDAREWVASSEKTESTEHHGSQLQKSSDSIGQQIEPKRPLLDKNRFQQLIGERTLESYIQACGLLIACNLPEEMNKLYRELMARIPVLQETIEKYKDVYKTDIDQFCNYYIPETLQLTAAYIEYLDVDIDRNIVQDTEQEVLRALEKLLLAVNEKIDEVYSFASMDIKAKARVLDTMMSQDGYVDPEFKIG